MSLNGLSTHINIGGVTHEVIVTKTADSGLATYVVVGIINDNTLPVSETIAMNWINVSPTTNTAISGNPDVVDKEVGEGLMINFSAIQNLPVKEFRILFSGNEENSDSILTGDSGQLKTTAVATNTFDISWFPRDYSTTLRQFFGAGTDGKVKKIELLKSVANQYSAVAKQTSFDISSEGALEAQQLFADVKVDTRIDSIDGDVAFGMSINSKDSETNALLLGGRNNTVYRVDRLHKIGEGEI